VKCFYHDDADGQCAGFWVVTSARINDKAYYKDEPKTYAMNYRSKFPLEIIRRDEQIYIVDYSISPEEMRDLLKLTPNVTWIDHHRTAIDKYKEFEQEIRGVRYDGIAACMLTYCYLKHMTSSGEGPEMPFDLSMTDNAPAFTKFIADADVLSFNYGEDTRSFFAGFNSCNFEPTSPEWGKFISNPNYENELIEIGKTIVAYETTWDKNYIKLGFETQLKGYKGFAINLGYSGIQFFNSLPEEEYDIFICFVFDGDQYIVSMYSHTVDVAKIAIEFGGGGHKAAAGFQCKELPFKKVIA
jgi:oligoribonuclease NrnB/cAMP/cGMP phosphodiesterase (DHH superfamily)